MRAPVETLYRDYLAHRQPSARGKLRFHGAEGFDVYNPTAPFRDGECWLIAARVEQRDSERSQVRFFHWQGGDEAVLLEDMPVLPLQDPFVCWLHGQRVLGGVEVEFAADGSVTRWRTQFWCGPTVAQLRPLRCGPWGMKDIRLVELADSRILVFTRPQGQPGGRGTIGWTLIDSLSELTAQRLSRATLLEHVDESDWCGANEAHLLADGRVGVLAHVARFDAQQQRHYYAASFIFNPHNGVSSPIKIIACRDDFLPGDSKRDDLRDVVFSGGLYGLPGKAARLFCGTSDCEVQWRSIGDPFSG